MNMTRTRPRTVRPAVIYFCLALLVLMMFGWLLVVLATI